MGARRDLEALTARGATTATLRPRRPLSFTSHAVLKSAGRLWFVAAVAGQWAFLYYIIAFYGPSAMTGDFHAWTRNTLLIKGYVAGDTAGNLTFLTHALLAAVIAFGGALQLIPWLRTRVPAFHRWNGRLFVLTALGVSITGLWMVWVRRATPDLFNALGVSLDGVLIIGFVISAWQSARARDLAQHRRWALRAYIVANGQFFTRVGFMAWVIVNQGPKHLPTFFLFWSFGAYLLPLAVLELYLLAGNGGGSRERLGLASGIVALTALMIVGTLGFMGLVRPFLATA